MRNKPEWFLRDVNPDGKVPTLKYGDDVLIESSVITEFIADLVPEAKLRSEDAFVGAQARLMSDRFMSLIGPFWGDFVMGRFEKMAGFLPAVNEFIPYLVDVNPFFGNSDKPTLPEIMVAPFLARWYLVMSNGHIPEVVNGLSSDPKYSVFDTWAKNLINYPSVKGIFEAEPILAYVKMRHAAAKAN